MSDEHAGDIRAGVVGVGSMGQHHARIYSELTETALVGVYDLDEETAADVADSYRTTVRTPAELFETVDAVSIAVTTDHHYELAKQSLQADVHTLVEKPFVENLDRGRELASIADERDLTLQVGHVERFNPAVSAVQRFVDDLDVIAVDAERLGPPLGRDLGDSVVMDLMIHDIDIVCSLVDSDINTVSASTSELPYTTATLEFENGVVGTLTASRITQNKVRELTIHARECVVSVDYIKKSVEIHRQSTPEYVEVSGDVRYRHEGIVERPVVEDGEPLKKELEAFVDAAESGDSPSVTAEDGLRAVEIVKTIKISTE